MDASVEFLLDNLTTLISNHVSLIQGASDELDLLKKELITFKAVLVDASRIYKKDATFRAWESEIREAVYDIEDVIDTCITQIAADKAKKMIWFRKLFSGTHYNLADAVRGLRAKNKPLFNNLDFAKFAPANADDSTGAEAAKDIRKQKSQHIVGFEKEAEEFVEAMITESVGVKILSVIGMAGLGKTTFAYKIFEDEKINFEFPIRLWVNISETLDMKNVLVTILKQLTNQQPDTTLSEDQLIDAVKSKLQEGRYFIVMDDVWETEAWKKVCLLLPEQNRWGRILITTRSKLVADYACTEKPHQLRFLYPHESWKLLQYEVYNKLDVIPGELVDVGKAIASECDGLPLSIVIIGGILMEKRSRLGDNIEKMVSEWSDIAQSVKNHLTTDKLEILKHIIALSYEKLPYELRNCFLYLGIFPEDADIPVKKLIRLWIAEGFIKGSGRDQKSLEEVAYNKLEELINLNLVMVRRSKPNGEPKICHMHDSIREICITEGSYDKLNLFQEITKSKQGQLGPLNNVDKFRRLCIHSYVLQFFSRGLQFPKARSFMCFNESVTNLKADQMSLITDGFGLLRVYDAKNIIFPKFPQKMMQLLHLRYLTLVVEKCEVLPDISILWNLQTLTVATPARVLKMKGDIWKMKQLRHFQTKASITLKSDGKTVDGGDNLQTIGRVSPDSCTTEFFSKAENLTSLGIQGDLNLLKVSCDGLGKLERMNKLKLVHQHSAGAAENPWSSLPEYRCFPAELKTLVLIETNLKWTDMSVLSNVPKLQVLKLKQNAFKGTHWEAKPSGFHHLIRLHVERSAELKYWTVLGDAFPALKYLYINNCERLMAVPSALGNKLEYLHIERARLVISSAQQIEVEQKKQGRVVKVHIAATDNNQES